MYENPHAIWKHLKETFFRDTAFSFVHQVANLCLLFTKLDKKKSVSEFLNLFDAQWNRVLQMAGGPDQYRQKFKAFLEEDFAKRDFLLAALSQRYQNPVDNLTTKANLTYDEVRHRMMALASTSSLEENNNNTNTALFTQTCTYFKKHGGNSIGHTWQDCRKLKRDQTRKQEKANKENAGNNNQQSSKQQGLIATALVSDAMDIDDVHHAHEVLSTCGRIMEL